MENVLSSRIVFECPIFKVEEADVRLASGSTAKRWYVVLPDGVSVVCLRNSRIIVLKELRSASQSVQWTLPGGVVEEGETSEQAAVREVIEETGLEPLDIRWLDTFRRPSVAFKQTFHLFMATRFRQVGPVEAGIEVNEFTFTDVAKLLDAGELIEQFTVYGKLRKLLQDGSVGGR